jgi:hypothetical protein
MFGMQYLVASFMGLLGGLTPIIAIVVLWFFLKQKKGQESDIPSLDLIDGRKLDSMVSQQVDAALKPLLKSEGYSDEQISAILTPMSLGGPKFRR